MTSLLLAAMMLTSCKEKEPSDFEKLVALGSTTWELTSAQDVGPVSFPGDKATFTYDAGMKKVRGDAFGNWYTVQVRADWDGALAWEGLAHSLKYAPPEMVAAMDRYTTLITKTRRLERTPDKLTLLSRDGRIRLEYRIASEP